MSEESYLTLAGPGEAETLDKHSRFIAHARPVTGEEQAKQFIAEMRALYPDATHNVYAYALRGGLLRWSDDGEPGGTSGQPTLNALRSAGVEDACCVVTRYFGGILLGSGGLVRAYGNAARLAVQAAGTVRRVPFTRCVFSCSYPLYDRLCRLLRDTGAQVENSSFGAQVEVIYTVPQGLAERAARLLAENSAGAVLPREAGTVLRPEK